MTTARDDESATEFAVRVVREEGQRAALGDLRDQVLVLQIAAVNKASENAQAEDWDANRGALGRAEAFHEVIGLIDEKLRELSA